VARSRYARGPFEPAPGNPILSHRSTDRPIQSTGHADLVQAPDGNWWLVLLGTRPRGQHPGWHVLGRETFLTPVTWVDDWPVVGPVEVRHRAPAEWQPVPPEPARDDFDAATLAPHWISPRSRPAGAWSLTERPGWLTLHATGSTLDRPGATFIGRAQPDPEVRVTARLDPGTGRGGLSIRIDEDHHYDIEVGADLEARAVVRIGPVRQCVATCAVPPGPVELSVEVRGPGTSTGPDTVVLSVGGVAPVLLAELDGRYLSTEVAGGFTGRVIGMYATEGSVGFDWFEVARS
jgi:beta-xylosidase